MIQLPYITCRIQAALSLATQLWLRSLLYRQDILQYMQILPTGAVSTLLIKEGCAARGSFSVNNTFTYSPALQKLEILMPVLSSLTYIFARSATTGDFVAWVNFVYIFARSATTGDFNISKSSKTHSYIIHIRLFCNNWSSNITCNTREYETNNYLLAIHFFH